MHPTHPRSPGNPNSGPLRVVRPPWVSFRDGVIRIEAPAVRGALEIMPPTVVRVGFSADAEPSPRERELFDTMAPLLQKGGEAVVAIRPLSEAVKVVREGWVVGSRDRSLLATVACPVLIDRHVLERLLGEAGAANRLDLVQALLATGGTVMGISPSA